MNYEQLLSDKCKEIKPSGIRKFFDIANSMEGVISLGVGEPDFATPWTVRSKAISVLQQGNTVYTANSGLFELRKAISEYLIRKNNLKYDPNDEIIVTVGGSEAIDLCVRAVVNPGDEVLVVEPSFVCYKPIVELMHGVPVVIETKPEDNFKLTAEALREKITDKTKLLILPFPNNPTGAILTRPELEKIANVLRDTNVLVLTDEIYSELSYQGKHVSIAEIDGMQERTLYVNGFSKAFAMTGWRLGYVAGPHELVTQMLKIHQYAIMCSPTVSQFAAVDALEKCDKDVQAMVREYDMRRRYIVNAFNELGLECFEPGGAFYVFPCIKSTGLTSQQFCEDLLMKHKVAVVPGDAFGSCGEGYIRVSYAYSLQHLKTAIGCIGEYLRELKNEQA